LRQKSTKHGIHLALDMSEDWQVYSTSNWLQTVIIN